MPAAGVLWQGLAALGVLLTDCFPERFSDDTIGNAFMACVMHTKWRSA